MSSQKNIGRNFPMKGRKKIPKPTPKATPAKSIYNILNSEFFKEPLPPRFKIIAVVGTLAFVGAIGYLGFSEYKIRKHK